MVFSSELVIKNGYYGFIVSGFEGFDNVIIFKRKAWVYRAGLAQGVELVCSHGNNLRVATDQII
jgi:hypothetical protein